VVSEPFLKRAHYWLAESGERSLWPRSRANSIHNVFCLRVNEDLEELFAALGVVCQRSIREAKPSDLPRASDAVEDTATVQGPKPQMSDQYGDDCTDCDRRVPRERFDPANIELLPGQ
jgi:hypothetical protein